MNPLRFLLVFALLSGCASRDVVTDEPIDLEIYDGPPCRITVYQGGNPEPALVVRNPRGSTRTCGIR